jgi:hypothetical protein
MNDAIVLAQPIVAADEANEQNHRHHHHHHHHHHHPHLFRIQGLRT